MLSFLLLWFCPLFFLPNQSIVAGLSASQSALRRRPLVSCSGFLSFSCRIPRPCGASAPKAVREHCTQGRAWGWHGKNAQKKNRKIRLELPPNRKLPPLTASTAITLCFGSVCYSAYLQFARRGTPSSALLFQAHRRRLGLSQKSL